MEGSTMHWITGALQLIVALGLLNVWLLRSTRETPYRGCGSRSLKDEFNAYGLPPWSFFVVGFVKISSAFALLLGFWKPALVFPAAFVIAVLMTGAVAMHLKVRDPVKKSLPAAFMLICSIAICMGSTYSS